MRIKDANDELLVILMEECGEVIQEASKLLRFEHTEENLKRFAKEIGDLQCMIDLCQEYDLISFTDIDKHSMEKRVKLKKWSSLI